MFPLVKKLFILKIQGGTHLVSGSRNTVPEMGPPGRTVDSFCDLYNKNEEMLRKLLYQSLYYIFPGYLKSYSPYIKLYLDSLFDVTFQTGMKQPPQSFNFQWMRFFSSFFLL